MKSVSKVEEIAARAWNVLNEGKSFTPVFVWSCYFLYHWQRWLEPSFWGGAGIVLLLLVPFYWLMAHYDFPLHLRWYLLLPLLLAVGLLGWAPYGLYLLAVGLYFFFTVFFWGTLYYHLRIGTPWNNYTRFWKLVLRNSDSTSGNAREQLPKILFLLTLMHQADVSGLSFLWQPGYFILLAVSFLLAYIVHRLGFTWRPLEPANGPNENEEAYRQRRVSPPAKRVIMVVIDGCRKDRLEQARTPFLDRLRREGVDFARMETLYPARTVVCFSSMFTGAYPRQHGIRSNMVWRPGVRVESIFDVLKQAGKKGVLMGIAHLIDAFGSDVHSYTAVADNRTVDAAILEEARRVMRREEPDLLIVQLISTDQTGHSRGALYPEYLAKIEEADGLIRDFYDWLIREGYMDEAAFIVCADHGQSDGIGGHGHLDDGERWVPFFMAGSGIRSGVRVNRAHSLVSVAPTLAHLLGVRYPSASRGPVLHEALTSLENVNGRSTG